MESMNKSLHLHLVEATKIPVSIPTIVYIVITMAVGVVGNSLVLCMYCCKIKKHSNYRLFVLMLATVDMAQSCLGMPGILVDMLRTFTFYSNSACKILRIVSHMILGASSTTHLIIGIERYRKICKPLQRQISTTMAKIILLVILILSFILSLPAFLLYGKCKFTIRHTNVTVSLCVIEKSYARTPYPAIYESSLFTLLVSTVLTLFVIYILIARRIWKTKRAVHPFVKTFGTHESRVNGNEVSSQNVDTMTEELSELTSKLKALKELRLLNKKENSSQQTMQLQSAKSKLSTIAGVEMDERTVIQNNDSIHVAASGSLENITSQHENERSQDLAHTISMKRKGEANQDETVDNAVGLSGDQKDTSEEFENQNSEENDTNETRKAQKYDQSVSVEMLRRQKGDKKEATGTLKTQNNVENETPEALQSSNSDRNDTYHTVQTHVRKNKLAKKKTLNSKAVGKHSRKVTSVSFAITFVFIISYVPHFVLTIMASVNQDRHIHLTATQEALYRIGYLSYIINNAANPFIYYAMDNDFKIQCKTLICKCCSRFSNKK